MLHVNKTYFWFVLFLISHGAILKFRCNLLIDRRRFKSIREYVGITRSAILIGGAFRWRTTAEGLGYWYELSEKWQSTCERFNIK